MTIKTAFVLLAAMTAATTACSGPSPSTSETFRDTRASLHRAKSCGELTGDLKADAKFKLNESIDRQILSIQRCVQTYGDAACASYGGLGYEYGDRSELGRPTSGAAADNGASGASGATPPAPSSSASSYSQTNVQVKGVDEADIVKTDGARLFLVHGRALKVLKAWPADQLAESSTTDIEGDPSEMFVANGKAVVYSHVNGADVFAAAGVQPKAAYQEFYYPGGGPMPAQRGGGGAGGGMTAASPPAYTSGPYYPLTKITVLDVAASPPVVTREVYFEGGYLDSRRVGNNVRTVLQNPAHGPKLVQSLYELDAPSRAAPSANDPAAGSSGSGSASPTPTPTYPQSGSESIAALDKLRGANIAIIDASQLSDWLPYTFVKDGGKVRAQTIACEDFYIPSVGSTEAGMTEIASLDLGNPAGLPKETAILGRAETVYGSADTLYLAANAWVETPFAWDDGNAPSGSGASGGGTAVSTGNTAAPPPPTQVGTKSVHPLTSGPAGAVSAWPTNKSHIHKFELATDPTFPNYVASGTVAGAVKDQFSLDDKDGFLRIATTESRLYVDSQGKRVQGEFGDPTQTTIVRPNTVNRLFVLGAKGPWLDVVGDAGELAPNEQLYSVRFVGPRGYVTTFRRVDPLFVFDLSQPAAPRRLAELTIPGFSEYMHPLDANHLLTIGRDATTSGRTQGLQLRIFDVTNGAAPAIVQQYTYSSNVYGSSEAEYDHKAFTYFEDKQLLAFPYWSSSSSGGSMRSSLEVFKVDAGAGFSKVGSIDHTSLVSGNPGGYSCGYYSPQVRRGVFLESWVFSVSYGGVVAKDSSNMAAPGATLPLSAPVPNTGYAPTCAY